MTLPIGTSTTAIHPAEAKQTGAPEQSASREKLAEAAREFDAVFVRIVLKSLEKTTSMGGGSSGLSAGQSAYGSMVVDTVANAVTRAGGTGLADQLMAALGPRLAPPEQTEGATPAPTGTPALKPPGPSR